jgi:oxalate decarboxylase
MKEKKSAATAAGGLLTAASVASAQTGEGVPQPRCPGHGGTDPGPRNLMRDRQNPGLLVPPSTDHGTLPNLRFSFSDAHVRQESGGWTRQVTVRELGISKNIAGVNMRLNRGGVRERCSGLRARHVPSISKRATSAMCRSPWATTSRIQ